MRINATSVTRRTNEIWSRSLKNETQEAYLRLSARCIDLTTLEGADTEGRVARLVRKAVKPDEGVEPVAAVCVYADYMFVAHVGVHAKTISCASKVFPNLLSPFWEALTYGNRVLPR